MDVRLVACGLAVCIIPVVQCQIDQASRLEGPSVIGGPMIGSM